MGCGQSNAAIMSNADRSKDFCSLVAQKHVLAVAMDKHWKLFLKEGDSRVKGDMEVYQELVQTRQPMVEINSDLNRALLQKLTFDSCNRVGESFLGHAMETLAKRKWGGSLKHSLRGAPGKESRLSVTGSIAYMAPAGSHGQKCTVPYSVYYSFFVS